MTHWYKPDPTNLSYCDKLRQIAPDLNVSLVDDKKNPIDHATLCALLSEKLAQGKKFNSRMKYPELPPQINLFKMPPFAKTVELGSMTAAQLQTQITAATSLPIMQKAVQPLVKVATLTPPKRPQVNSLQPIAPTIPIGTAAVGSVVGTMIATGGGAPPMTSAVVAKIISEAKTLAFNKSEELGELIGIKCLDATTNQAKKKLMSPYIKMYSKWFENNMTSFYERYCGKFTDLSLIGQGNAAQRLPYTPHTCEALLAAFKQAIRMTTKIPAMSSDDIWLLTPAKGRKMVIQNYILCLQYRAYFEYVDTDRSTTTEKDAEQLFKKCTDEFKGITKALDENNKIKMKKGPKAVIEKMLNNFNGSLLFRGIKGLKNVVKKSPVKSDSDTSVSSSGSTDKVVKAGSTTKTPKLTAEASEEEDDSEEEEEDDDDDVIEEDDDDEKPAGGKRKVVKSKSSKKGSSKKLKVAKATKVTKATKVAKVAKVAKATKPKKAAKAAKVAKAKKEASDSDDDDDDDE
jgi:hypothetical protein